MTETLVLPVSCVLQIDKAAARYELLQQSQHWQALLPVPRCGHLLQDWVQAGLPQLSAERLLQALRSERAVSWSVDWPAHSAWAAHRSVLLTVSPLTNPSDAETAQSIVTLSPQPVTWPRARWGQYLTERGVQACVEIDPELRLTRTGSAWEDLCGYAEAACLGRPLTDFLHPKAHAELQRVLTQASAATDGSEPHRLRLPLRHQQGGLVWAALEAEALPQASAASAGWRIWLEDVSANVRALHLDRVREQAFDQSNCGVIVTDATLPHEPIVYVNQRFTEITGYTLDEVRGKPCNFLQGTDRQQPGIARLRAAIQEGKSISELLRNYRKDGSMFWSQLNVVPILDERTGILTHHFGIVSDVTQTTDLLEQLSSQTAMLQSLHHDNPNGLIAFDSQSRVQLENQAFTALTGLQVKGLTREQFFAQMEALSAVGQEPLEAQLSRGVTVQWQLHKPRERVLEIRGSQPDSAQQPRLLVLRDVSAEVQLHRMQRQFLATAAHEMRAPLGSIRGFSELLLVRDFPVDVQRDLIQRIHRQSGRLTDLLNDLLNLARIEAQAPGSVKLEDVALTPLLHEVVQTFEQPGSAPRLVLPAQVPCVSVRAQPAQLEQVLINIVSNALKYSSPEDGPVCIDLRPAPHAGQWQIVVADRGVGMSPQTLGRLFTKFFRVDPHGDIEGTGLGLCIAKELLERMGGSISVHSQLGQGSTFTLQLPGLPMDTPLLAT